MFCVLVAALIACGYLVETPSISCMALSWAVLSFSMSFSSGSISLVPYSRMGLTSVLYMLMAAAIVSSVLIGFLLPFVAISSPRSACTFLFAC